MDTKEKGRKAPAATKATAQTPETGTAETTEDTTGTPDAPTDSAEAKTAKETTEDMTGALALDYLSGGYYKGEGKASYPDPALVGETAKRLAQELAQGGLKQTAFNPILRELKKANKKTLPLEAKQGALSGALITAKQLVQRHRASSLLVDVLKRNREAVQSDADYAAAVKHLTAVGVYLGDYQK